MSKGGFLSALLAERHSSSTTGFAWRSLYYICIGIPLLVVYYIVFHTILTLLILPVANMYGFATHTYRLRVLSAAAAGDFQELARLLIAETWVLGAVKLVLVVLLYHFGALDVLLEPVYFITKV
jgi:hypothetical protein